MARPDEVSQYAELRGALSKRTAPNRREHVVVCGCVGVGECVCMCVCCVSKHALQYAELRGALSKRTATTR